MIKLKKHNGTFIPLDRKGITFIEKAEVNREIMSKNVVKLNVNSVDKIDFSIGDSIEVFNESYRLNKNPKITKKSNRQYIYDIEFESVMYDLLRVNFFNQDANGFKTDSNFSLIGTIDIFIKTIVNNTARLNNLWIDGQYPSTKTKTISFSNDNCLSALQKVCKEFKTEFRIDLENGKNVIKTGSFGQILPYSFSYGKGKGLYELTRENSDNKNTVNRLYVTGGSKNIPSDYRNYSQKLKLPNNKDYIEDTSLINDIGLNEGFIDIPEIYPHRTGKITTINASDVNSFEDTTMDFDLNEKDSQGNTKYLIAGTSAKVHFNTGNLAGHTFEIKKNGYNHSSNKFSLIPIKDKTGLTFPSEDSSAFQFSVDDEYVLLDIVMPQSYIDNAEQELLTKATEQFNQIHSKVKSKYNLSFDWEYLKRQSSVTNINVGDYINIKDARLGIDKSIQITSITRNILDEYDYKITVADDYQIKIVNQLIYDVKELKDVVVGSRLNDIRQSKIIHKTTEELKNVVFDTDGYFDTENIKPFSIETSMLSVGTRSQQVTCNLLFIANKNQNPNLIEVIAGSIYSQTFDKEWSVSGKTETIPDNNFRYVYGKCSKNNLSASILFSSDKKKYDNDVNDYYFLLGVLHSVVQDYRVLSITYGSTTINGGLVRTGKISSQDGQTVFDLNAGNITGNISFISNSPAFNQIKNYIKPDIDNAYAEAQNAKNIANIAKSKTDFLSTDINGNVISTGLLLVGSLNGANAGITGVVDNGNDSVRFFAGSNNAGKDTAPFRVLNNGKLHANNAIIKGKIDATSGKIGGFLISSGRIGTTKDQNGLTLGNEHIFFRNNDTLASIGTNVLPLSYSIVGLGKFEYTGSSQCFGLLLKVRPTGIYKNTSKALNVDGNVEIKGGVTIYDDTYIGTAYTNTIKDNIKKTHQFLFTDISSNYINVSLPGISDIGISSNETFKIEITMGIGVGTKRIRLLGSADGILLNNNSQIHGGSFGEKDLATGDTLTLRFHAGYYYISSQLL